MGLAPRFGLRCMKGVRSSPEPGAISTVRRMIRWSDRSLAVAVPIGHLSLIDEADWGNCGTRCRSGVRRLGCRGQRGAWHREGEMLRAQCGQDARAPRSSCATVAGTLPGFCCCRVAGHVRSTSLRAPKPGCTSHFRKEGVWAASSKSVEKRFVSTNIGNFANACVISASKGAVRTQRAHATFGSQPRTLLQ
jgi:hypothetical protein